MLNKIRKSLIFMGERKGGSWHEKILMNYEKTSDQAINLTIVGTCNKKRSTSSILGVKSTFYYLLLRRIINKNWLASFFILSHCEELA